MSAQLTWQLAARISCSVLALVALAATPASPQAFLGRIDLTTLDRSGAVVPGARVDVTGPRRFSGVTDQQGEAHFLNLPVGTYQVRVTLQGFADYLNENVPVVAGGSSRTSGGCGARLERPTCAFVRWTMRSTERS